MKFPEPKTFRGATSPVTVIRWALGIGTLEYPTGRPQRFLSLCWSGTILILFLYFLNHVTLSNLSNQEIPTFSKTSYQMYLIVVMIYGTTSLYLGQVRSKNIVDSLCKIERINEMLNKFGIPKEYGSIFKSQIIHIIGAVFFMLTITVFPIMIMFDDAPIGPVISGQYIILVSLFENYTFTICIRYIGNRFRHLNTYLGKLSIEEGNIKPLPQGSDDRYISWLTPTILENHVQSRYVAGANEQWMMRILQNAKKIHRDLCDTAKNLNEEFGFQILTSMTTGIAVITTILFNAYILLFNSVTITWSMKIKIICDLPWIGFHVMKILYTISACSMASTEAHQTGDRIHELVNPTTSDEIREEIHAFALQLMQDPLRFTAYGFFTLDETMIRAMVGTVTTYLVFMIQTPRAVKRVNSSTRNVMLLGNNNTV